MPETTSALLLSHLLEDLSKLLDLFAVERPVAVTLRLQRALVVRTCLVRERARIRGRQCLGACRSGRRRRRWLTLVGRLKLRAHPAPREDALQRGVERRLHDDVVLVRDDDAFQLGDLPAGGLQVERSYVNQRLLDR